MIDPVIVGFDGRDPSHDALALGAALAHGSRSLLAAWVRGEEGQLSTATDIRVARERYAESTALRTEVLARAPRTRQAQTLLVAAPSPAAGLHSLAEERGCAALVVGSSHRGPVGRVLPGSTSRRLLDFGAHAVAVAPRGLALRDAGITTVGVGFDHSPASFVALQAGLDLARELGAHAVAFTVTESATSRIGAVTLSSGEDVELVSLEGEAVGALVRAASDVDLLVVGSRSPRHGLGSVSRHLAHQCPAPLLVAPERARREKGERLTVSG